MVTVPDLGLISLRAIDNDHPRPQSPSEWGDWGPTAPEVRDLVLYRWLIELTDDSHSTTAIGDMSAHAIWYGPTLGSRAMNIGISLLAEYRGVHWNVPASRSRARCGRHSSGQMACTTSRSGRTWRRQADCLSSGPRSMKNATIKATAGIAFHRSSLVGEIA